jgi:hypothetical protein
MTRRTQAAAKPRAAGEFVELVSPSGHRKETPLNALRENQLRFDGYLPVEQAKLEAPESPDSGSSGLTGAEKTEGSAS